MLTRNPALRTAVNAQLESGERILWIGKPIPMRVALQDQESLRLGGLALLALLFALVGFISARAGGFILFGGKIEWVAAFFVVLLLAFLARPAYEFLMAMQTIYAVTNRRALTLKPTLKGRIVQSYSHIQHIERHDLADGKGDLIFGSENRVSQSARYGARVRARKIGFFGIEGAREVEAMMLRTFTGTQGDEPL